MQTVTQNFGLLWNALFLDRRSFVALKDAKNPGKRGLGILIVLGIAIALTTIIGTTLRWASSPSLTGIRDAIYQRYINAPWWQFIEQESQALDMFDQIWDQIWQAMSFIFPTPTSSLSALIFKPFALIISWFIFALLAYFIARVLGGTGSFGQTLGTTSLAAAPQMLLLLTILPFVAIAGVGTWVLLCRYMAIRVTHELSWARAVWAVILPPIIISILIMILALISGLLFGAVLFSVIGGG